MISQYKDLIFWQKAYKTSLIIVKVSRNLPSDRVSNIIISQVLRSSMSIGANIAEGFGRYKGKEYGRFLQIALGSANETDYWLILMIDIFPEFRKDLEIAVDLNLETIKMLATSLKTLRNKKEKDLSFITNH